MGFGQRPSRRSSIQDLCCAGGPLCPASTFSSCNDTGPHGTLCALLGLFCNSWPDLQGPDKPPPVGCGYSPLVYMDGDLCLVLDYDKLNLLMKREIINAPAKERCSRGFLAKS